MVFDDYKSYSGCCCAVDEWLAPEDWAEIVFSNKSVGVMKRL